MLKIGDSNINDLRLGTTGVTKAYLGEIQVWPSGSPTPTQPYVRMGAGYLDTGIVPTENTKIEYVGYTSQVAPVFGSGTFNLDGTEMSANGMFLTGFDTVQGERLAYAFGDMHNYALTSEFIDLGYPNVRTITLSKDGLVIDGETITSGYTGGFEANGSIWLGSEANLNSNVPNLIGQSAVSSFKIWEDNELVFHIEAKDSKHFYDRINDTVIDRYWKAPQPSFFSIKEFPEEELGISGVRGVYDTGYVAGPNTKVDIYFRPTTEHSDWGGIIGAQTSDDDNTTFQIRYNALSPELIARIGSTVTDNSFSPEEGKVYVATLDAKLAEGWTPTSNTLFLNAIHNNEWADDGYRSSQNEIFLVYIYENDEIIQAFYSDGEGHLLDMEENIIEPIQ